MHILVIYDVSDNKKRRNVVKVLNGYGTRVQKSAYECIITNAMSAALEKKLARIIDKTDSVRIYHLSTGAIIKSFGLENNVVYGSELYLII